MRARGRHAKHFGDAVEKGVGHNISISGSCELRGLRLGEPEICPVSCLLTTRYSELGAWIAKNMLYLKRSTGV